MPMVDVRISSELDVLVANLSEDVEDGLLLGLRGVANGLGIESR